MHRDAPGGIPLGIGAALAAGVLLMTPLSPPPSSGHSKPGAALPRGHAAAHLQGARRAAQTHPLVRAPCSPMQLHAALCSLEPPPPSAPACFRNVASLPLWALAVAPASGNELPPPSAPYLLQEYGASGPRQPLLYPAGRYYVVPLGGRRRIAASALPQAGRHAAV